FRIGVRGMEMFMPAARLGLHFYRRGLERYCTRLGLDNAKRLFLTAETAKAEQMLAMGFLTHLVEPGELAGTADQLCATVAAMAPIAVIGVKKHRNRIERGTLRAEDMQRDNARGSVGGPTGRNGGVGRDAPAGVYRALSRGRAGARRCNRASPLR